MEVEELYKAKSLLAIENAELAHELEKVRQENEELRQEIESLKEEISERDEIHLKTRQQLAAVTETVTTLYNRFRDFKIRYYREQGLG